MTVGTTPGALAAPPMGASGHASQAGGWDSFTGTGTGTGAGAGGGAAIGQAATSAGTPSGAYTSRLAARVKEQAKELTELRTRLTDTQAYADLCERRILELVPDHPIPVTPECLGIPAPSPPQKHGRTKGTPSRVLSAEAAQRREKSETASAFNTLQRQLRQAQVRQRETTRQLRDARAALAAKERELASSRKRGKSEHERAAEAAAAARQRGQALQQARNDLATQAALHGDAEQTPASQRIAELESLLREAQGHAEELNTALQRESLTVEKQSAQIEVLEKSLKQHAEDVGLQGHGQLLTELARLRGEVDARDRDLAQREEISEQLQVRVTELQTQLDMQRDENHRLVTGRGATAIVPAEPSDSDDPATQLAKLRDQKTALLDYLQETRDAKAALQEQFDALKAAEETHLRELDEATRRAASAEEAKQEATEVAKKVSEQQTAQPLASLWVAHV